MSTVTPAHGPRFSTSLRETARVTPLELFFDLVFVLAITECTALMAALPTWTGLARGMLVLGVLWWSWVGYAWLTSVVDPEDGTVRMTIFVAMGGTLVAALCVRDAFGSTALLFACAYAVVRIAHIALFTLGSRGDPALRHSVKGLAVGTAVGVGLLFAAAFAGGALRAAFWVLALALDSGGPFLFGADGWKLVPGHFAERHGGIVIIALGESIVALGVGTGAGVDTGIVVASLLGLTVAAALWWLYFDIVALVAERRLTNAEVGRERNEIARDSYSYLHFPMVAGIVLVALGLKTTLVHVGHHLQIVPATALLGGAALYLLAHVAFRLRNVRTLNRQRLVCAGLLIALLPVAVRVPSLVSVAMLAVLLTALIAYEAMRFAESRERLRRTLLHEVSAD